MFSSLLKSTTERLSDRPSSHRFGLLLAVLYLAVRRYNTGTLCSKTAFATRNLMRVFFVGFATLLGCSSDPVQSQNEARTHVVHKAVTPAQLPAIPKVYLSTAHARLCELMVGDTFSDILLPLVGGKQTKLYSLRGQQATVILFWQPDRWMAHMALADLQTDIVNKIKPDPAENTPDISVLGIAVRQSERDIQAALKKSNASFPQLLDSQGDFFESAGKYALPRVYVLDATGKIVWFDIEYSESTRRELAQTLSVLTGK
ncbi:MAG: TlpA family protein disulfide reductase [Pirellulales bacterium]|nr:TlpA family protein disulfide reductase [Pirellulales bacterium]